MTSSDSCGLPQKLRAGHRSGADTDAEDAALSVFDSFCDGAARGRFPQLVDRDDLWRLLVTITTYKVTDHARRHGGRSAAAAAFSMRRPWTGRANYTFSKAQTWGCAVWANSSTT